MNRIGLFCLAFFLLGNTLLTAQMTVPPCPEPAHHPMFAPLVDCCLDGYTYQTMPSNETDTPPDFCGSIENPQYLAFLATFTDINFSITPSNCIGMPLGTGLQAQVFGINDGCTVDDLFAVSNCYNPSFATPGNVTATNLEIGHVYYLLIDGWAGDFCDYTIDIIDTQNEIDGPSIVGPTLVTTGQTANYSYGYGFDIVNPCGNFKQDTIICTDTCQIVYSSIAWTAPTGSTIAPTSDPLSVDITLGDMSGYICLAAETNCGSFQECLYVEVLSPDCNFPLPPGDACAEAVPFCDTYLQEFCTSNMGFTADTTGGLSELLDCSIENNQWLTFVACSENVSIDIWVEQCQFSMGLEFSVLQKNDAQAPTVIQQCQSIAATDISTLTVPNLTVGEVYYLMIDGMDGDICKWEIVSTDGISDGPVLQEENTPGYIVGADTICQGVPVTFTLIPPNCQLLPVTNEECPIAIQQFCEGLMPSSADYEIQYDTAWNITPSSWEWVNADSTGESITVTWPFLNSITGDFEITVEITENILSDTDTIQLSCLAVCADILPDDEACSITPHSINVQTILPIIEEVFVICPGDTIDYFGNLLFEEDFYFFEIPNAEGCDILHLVEVFEEEITMPDISLTNIECLPNNNEYQVTITVTNANNAYFVNGIAQSDTVFLSPPMSSGMAYFFEISFTESCLNSVVLEGVHECPCITQAGTIDTEMVLLCGQDSIDIQHNDDAVLDGNDVLSFIVQNEVGDLLLQNNSSIFTFQNGLMNYGEPYYFCALAGNNDGTGKVDLNDQCHAISECKEVIFYENLTGSIEPLNEINCSNTTVFPTVNVSGGSGEFSYQWTDLGGFIDNTIAPVFENAGIYNLEIKDVATGCFINISAEVVGNFTMPMVEIGDDLEILPGEIITLEPITDVLNPVFEWYLNGQSVDAMVFDNFQPTENVTVTVLVIDENGCIGADDISIQILAIQDLYAPNIFSPNGDGQNDYFTFFGGQGKVVQIKKLQIFNRWGSLIFEQKDFQPNDEKAGWDGRGPRREIMTPQIFVYSAEVEMLDGTVTFLQGDVALMR